MRAGFRPSQVKSPFPAARSAAGPYPLSRYVEGASSGDLALFRRETAHQRVEKRESVVVRLRPELLITPMRVGFARQRENSAHSISRNACRTKETPIGRPSRHRWNYRNVAEHFLRQIGHGRKNDRLNCIG